MFLLQDKHYAYLSLLESVFIIGQPLREIHVFAKIYISFKYDPTASGEPFGI